MVSKWPCGQFPQQTLMSFEMLAACWVIFGKISHVAKHIPFINLHSAPSSSLALPLSNLLIEIHRSPSDRDHWAYLNLE